MCWVLLVRSYRPLHVGRRPLEILLRPHVHNLQRCVGQFDYMTWLQRFRVDVVYVMRMKDARSTTVENGLFARGIGEAETTPAVA